MLPRWRYREHNFFHQHLNHHSFQVSQQRFNSRWTCRCGDGCFFLRWVLVCKFDANILWLVEEVLPNSYNCKEIHTGACQQNIFISVKSDRQLCMCMYLYSCICEFVALRYNLYLCIICVFMYLTVGNIKRCIIALQLYNRQRAVICVGII